MKKLALIMLAVVSMALVSCGGGSGDVKLADPPVTYYHDSDEIDVEVKINSFDVKASGDDKTIKVSAKIELTSKGFSLKTLEEIYAKAKLLDKNEEVVAESKSEGVEIVNIGEVGLFSTEIDPEEGLTASETLEKVKYIRFTDVYGFTWD